MRKEKDIFESIEEEQPKNNKKNKKEKNNKSIVYIVIALFINAVVSENLFKTCCHNNAYIPKITIDIP